MFFVTKAANKKMLCSEKYAAKVKRERFDFVVRRVFHKHKEIIGINPCIRLDLQCRKIHDLGAMDLAPSPTGGGGMRSLDWKHSPRAMKLGPIEDKDYCQLCIPIYICIFLLFMYYC